MAVEIEVNPTIVNVVTDVLLAVLTLIWIKSLSWWTASDIKRQLRKKHKIYSFEDIGTFSHMVYGIGRTRYARESEDDLKVVRSWYRLTFRAIVLFALSLFTIGAHILIDYGLDFRTVTYPSNDRDQYKMLEFSPTEEYYLMKTEIESINNERTAYTEEYCATTTRTQEECELDVLNMLTYCHERYREAFLLTSRFLDSASLEELDIVNKIFFSYNTVDNSEVSEGTSIQCGLKDNQRLESFGGSFALEGSESCKLGDVSAWLLNIGTKVERELYPVQNYAPKSLVARVTTNTQVFDFFGHRNIKDDRQVKTEYNVTREDNRGQKGAEKYARIDADANLRYANDTDQQIVLLDLDRARIADDKPPHALHTMGEYRVERELRSSEKTYCNDFVGEDLVFEEIDILGRDGLKCNSEKYKVQFGDIVCIQSEREIHGEKVHIALQSLQTLIFFNREEEKDSIFDTEDGCLKQAEEAFREELKYLEEDDEFAVVLALDTQIICATIEGQLIRKCIGGPGNYRFNGEGWIEASGESDGENTWTTASSSSWSAVQLVNVEKSKAHRVLENVMPIAQLAFRTVYAKVERNIMRQAVVGIRLNWSMQFILAALGTQLQTTTRDLFLFQTSQNTVLNKEYFLGIGFLLLITLLVVLLALAYHIHEQKAYKRLGLGMHGKVPRSKTEWIDACLPYLDGSDPDPDIFRHEFTSKPLEQDVEVEGEDDLARQKVISSKARIGFYSQPIPLNDLTDYELPGEDSL